MRKQVGISPRRGSVTSKEARGRDPVLSSRDLDLIGKFVKAFPEHRKMTYFEFAYGYFKYFGVSERVIMS